MTFCLPTIRPRSDWKTDVVIKKIYQRPAGEFKKVLKKNLFKIPPSEKKTSKSKSNLTVSINALTFIQL